jgi:hypothetical protein
MNTNELIEALEQRYGNPLAKDCGLIHEAIKVLQFQAEEIAACYQHIKELQEL